MCKRGVNKYNDDDIDNYNIECNNDRTKENKGCECECEYEM